MSRPKLLPPLAPETIAALERICPAGSGLASRHEVNAEADPRLLEIVRMMGKAERHFREMDAAAKAGEVVTFGTHEGKPARAAALWAKRNLESFNEVFRVAQVAGDDAFTLHLAAIERGLASPPLPMRARVWIGWKFCSTKGRKMTESELEQLIESQCHGADIGPPPVRQYIPTASEVAASIGPSDKVAELTARDCTNHLKALGLPYAPARGGFKRKSM